MSGPGKGLHQFHYRLHARQAACWRGQTCATWPRLQPRRLAEQPTASPGKAETLVKLFHYREPPRCCKRGHRTDAQPDVVTRTGAPRRGRCRGLRHAWVGGINNLRLHPLPFPLN